MCTRHTANYECPNGRNSGLDETDGIGAGRGDRSVDILGIRLIEWVEISRIEISTPLNIFLELLFDEGRNDIDTYLSTR